MYCLYGDTLDVAPVETPKRFGVLARYNERIWGSGITGDPDMLVYSAPYDPFDWEAQIEIPEDGAGDIQVPTWDGDSFVALRQYGSDLIALKRNSIWRVYGTNPGEFTVQRQYGGGALVENTVAVRYGVYSTDGIDEVADTLHDTLWVWTQRADGNDTLLLNRGVNMTAFSLPVSYQRPADTLIFLIVDTNQVWTLDTVVVGKEDTPHFESVDCNAHFFHRLTSVASTHRAIDTVFIIVHIRDILDISYAFQLALFIHAAEA
jgi:hypothetical protein